MIARVIRRNVKVERRSVYAIIIVLVIVILAILLLEWFGVSDLIPGFPAEDFT